MATTKTKNKQPENANEEGPSDFAKFAEGVKDRPPIYPRLTFGKKGDQGTHRVEFLEAKPREITFEDQFGEESESGELPKAKGFAINVRLLGTSFPEFEARLKRGEEIYGLVFRKDPNHGLTAGIATLLKAHNGTLLNVGAALTAENYPHEKYGETRGYRVAETRKPVPASGEEKQAAASGELL